MAEDEHQQGEERSEPEGGEGRPTGPMEEEERAPRPTEDRDPPGPGGPGGAGGSGGAGGRMGELMAKRRTTGLSDAEAEELGGILAEQEGKQHTSAQSLKRGPEAQE